MPLCPSFTNPPSSVSEPNKHWYGLELRSPELTKIDSLIFPAFSRRHIPLFYRIMLAVRQKTVSHLTTLLDCLRAFPSVRRRNKPRSSARDRTIPVYATSAVLVYSHENMQSHICQMLKANSLVMPRISWWGTQETSQMQVI